MSCYVKWGVFSIYNGPCKLLSGPQYAENNRHFLAWKMFNSENILLCFLSGNPQATLQRNHKGKYWIFTEKIMDTAQAFYRSDKGLKSKLWIGPVQCSHFKNKMTWNYVNSPFNPVCLSTWLLKLREQSL